MPRYDGGKRDVCPFCHTVVLFEIPSNGPNEIRVNSQEDIISLYIAQCPNCQRLIVSLYQSKYVEGSGFKKLKELTLWPLSSQKPPAPLTVPENIRVDYEESALVLLLSPKASAALSRRCLQTLLNLHGYKQRNLSQQIDEAMHDLPGYIAKNLDAVREIGNFAAHEQKSTSSGEILDVEPGEAEWNLDVLDALFDHYYVKPEIERKKREELNKKLQEAGKPLLPI